MASNSQSNSKSISTILILLVAGILLGGWLFNKPSEKSVDIPELLSEPRQLTDIALTNHKNSILNSDSLSGKWSFIFFGYTHCPDVCPTTLSELSGTYTQLSTDPALDGTGILNDTQFIFISVDPERDTPEYLASYITYFNESFLAATGTKEQLMNITRQFGIKHSRGDKTRDGYLVNHASAVMLVNPLNQYYARFKAPHYSEHVKQQYLSIRKFFLEHNSTQLKSDKKDSKS